jgi:low affinity Fe/Cu permease
MSESVPSLDRERSPVRRLLSWVDRWASRPLTALIVIAADTVWVLLSVAMGFPGLGERVFQTLVAAVTLAMVFVIQHTQAREQAATQRKLDEILHALPGADNSLLTLEHASHDELRAAGDSHRAIRQAAVEDQSGAANPLGDGQWRAGGSPPAAGAGLAVREDKAQAPGGRSSSRGSRS